MSAPTSSDEERETLIAEAREAESSIRAENEWVAETIGRLADALYNAHRTLEFDKHHMDDLAAALAAQRPVWEVQAEALEAAESEISGYYPEDLWRPPTDEQLRALHVFAESIGLGDGSPFHVHGIRHALRLVQERAAELRRSGALAHSHAPDTGMWAGCQACTAGGGG